MQIEYNNKQYEITSYSTIKNLNTFKTLIDNGIRLEDIKSYDKASDLLPDLFNSSNDVPIGEILRNLRYHAKNNKLPQIWQDFFDDNGYNFNIQKIRVEQQRERYGNSIIKILQVFVDNSIDLNNITQRATAKEILPNIFNDSNDIKIGYILEYIRMKYKTNSLPQSLINFLQKNNFKFSKENWRELKPKQKLKGEPKQKKLLKTAQNKQKLTQKATNPYKKSKSRRNKVEILKLIALNSVDLNSIEKSVMASQLLPEKTISSDEDFCVGKLIYNVKNKFNRGQLSQSLYNFLIKLGVNFSIQKPTIIQTQIIHNSNKSNAPSEQQASEQNVEDSTNSSPKIL